MSFKRKNKFSRYKAPIILCMGALLTGVISFMITVKVYDDKFEKENIAKEKQELNMVNENIIAKVENKDFFEKVQENIEISETKEEIKEEILDVPEISLEEYEEFVGIFAKEENESENVVEVSSNAKNDDKILKDEKKKLEFVMPLEGDYGLNYATEKLIYSNTLEEWITHNGIDIIGEEAEPVKAIESGVVESIKMDPRYGNTIIIKHDDEYKSVYSNLSTIELVFVGKKVEKGEIISGVGIGFGFESKEEPHVHLTILKNGESVNPEEVMK